MSAVTIKSVASGTGKVDWLEVVRQPVASLRYGVVQIVVHDAQVTQIGGRGLHFSESNLHSNLKTNTN